MTDKSIIKALCQFDEEATKEYFYGYCRRAYHIYNNMYQLSRKTGLDFYSLAHEYYIHLLKHDFKPLLDKPKGVKLSTWMLRGFHFVVLDGLKAYNKEFDAKTVTDSDVMLEYVRSTDKEEGMMQEIVDAVAAHYHDPVMQEIAHMVFYAGFKQKDVAEVLGITPSAVNQRIKKMMDEVVTPFIIENYGMGIYDGAVALSNAAPSGPPPADECIAPMGGIPPFYDSETTIPPTAMQNSRITPELITSLRPNEIFVFGSNLHGIHAGGAARAAVLHFGAEMGNGIGIQGQSYAIPTMQGGVETIKPYVDDFIAYAQQHPGKHFLVTPIGCGIAGFEPEDIAPLFKDAKDVENISLPEVFWELFDDLLFQ